MSLGKSRCYWILICKGGNGLISVGKRVAISREMGDIANNPILAAMSRDTINKQAVALAKMLRVLESSDRLNWNKQPKKKDKAL